MPLLFAQWELSANMKFLTIILLATSALASALPQEIVLKADSVDAPEAVVEAIVEPVIETSPIDGPENAPLVAPEVALDVAPEAALDVAAETAPIVAAEAAPVAVPEAAPVAVPEAAPVAVPEAAPEAAPVAAPEAAPEVGVETAPAAPAEVPFKIVIEPQAEFFDVSLIEPQAALQEEPQNVAQVRTIPILPDVEGDFDLKIQSKSGQLNNKLGRQVSGDIQPISGVIRFTFPNGTPFELSYVADENGFRPVGPLTPERPLLIVDKRRRAELLDELDDIFEKDNSLEDNRLEPLDAHSSIIII